MAKTDNKDVNKILVENFVSLQRVMTNLSFKFDNLSTQISKLLELFEISAKTLAEKNSGEMPRYGNQPNKEIISKIDNLIEQNKIMARGLTLIHENNSPVPREENEAPRMNQMPIQAPRKIAKPFEQMPQRKQSKTDGYQRSISDKNEQSKQF